MFPIELFNIISSLAHHNQRLSDELKTTKLEAITDSLTGLYNRRAFYEWVKYQSTLPTANDSHFEVAIIDIDRFKPYNDKFGHDAGDIALQLVCDSMIACSRSITNTSKDTHLFRWGGEEFLVVTNSSAKEMFSLLQMMRHTITAKSISLPRELTISAGFSALDINSTEACIIAADKALYRAKSTRDCVCSLDPIVA